jgi:hypothetical protein
MEPQYVKVAYCIDDSGIGAWTFKEMRGEEGESQL